jgi:hypothetical protein
LATLPGRDIYRPHDVHIYIVFFFLSKSIFDIDCVTDFLQHKN